MATTGRTLIEDALMEIGAVAAGDTVAAEDLDLGLRRLNALVSSLAVESRVWSLGPFDLVTDLSLPDGVERSLVALLGMELSPAFSRPISPDLRMKADKAQRVVERADLLPGDLRTLTPFDQTGDWDINTGP